MVIGIDIRVLGSSVKSGIEEYTENLLAHLLRADNSIEYRLFFSSFSGELPHYDWLELPNVTLFKYRIPNKVLFASSGLFDQPKFDKLLGGVDVFFSPHFFLAPVSSSCKRVTTFHDLSYVHFPEFFSLRKNLWHNLEMRPLKQSHSSDQIIAVSESTKRDLIKLYGADPAKIDVIYSGISGNIFRPSNYELSQFRIRNNVPENFLLFLGKLEPRKNIISIIRAFNIVKQQKELRDLKLVLAGSRGWLYKDIFREAQRSEYSKDIIFIDHVNDDDRKFYYSLASIFIYPSFFEGFGFPPLEVMGCGTPAICSNNSSFGEVAGPGALMVNSESVDELARAITSIYKDKRLRLKLIEAGNRNISKFSWQDTAQKTLSCLLK